MAFLTAYGALVGIGRLRPVDVALITAASSSVGLAAIQIALRQGAIPICTTNSPDKRERLFAAGCSAVIVPDTGDLVSAVDDLTDGQGANLVVFDAVAGPGIEDLSRASTPGGMILVHGSLSGRPTPLPGLHDMRPVFVRPYTLFEFTDDPERRLRAEHYITTGLPTGAFRPVIDRTFTLDDIASVHRYLVAGSQFGKIVVTVDAAPPPFTANRSIGRLY